MRRIFPLAFLLSLSAAGDLSAEPSALSVCEDRFTVAPESEEAAQCFADVGRNRGLAREAARRLEELIARHPNHPWLLFYLGNLRWGEPARAEEPYRRAAAAFARRGNATGEIRAHTALHSILTKLGRFDEATAEIDRVEALARQTGDSYRGVRVASLRAKQLRLQGGDMQRAYSLLSAVQDTLRPESPYTFQRDALEELANLSFELGRFTEARAWYGRLADLATDRGELRTAANARYGALRVLVEELKETPRTDLRHEVDEEARALLDLATQAQHRELAGRAHLALGQLSSGVESQAHLDQCLTNMVTVSDRISCMQALSRLRRREGDPEAALRILHTALDLARKAQSPWSRADVLRERMRASWEALPHEQALPLSEMALDWIETIRDQQSGDSSRAGLLSLWSEDYYWLAGRLLEDQSEPGSIAEAFGVIERLRARTLLESLEAARANPIAGESARQDRARHELALEGIAHVQRRLLDPDLPAEEREGALRELRRLEIAEASLRDLLVQKGQEPARTVVSGAALLPAVQRSLAPDEALLSFQIGCDEGPWGDFGGGSWLLVVTRDHVSVQRLRRDRVSLRPALRLFNGLFERRDGSEARPAAGLYQDLFADALRNLPSGIRRLVIVPDDALHQLPFNALRPTPGDLPLAYRYEVSVVPSANLWLHWRSRPPGVAAEPLLALADPVPLGGTAARPSTERAAIFSRPVRLGPLPYARREGKSAVRHLDSGSLLRLGSDASEGFFKSADLRRYAILHFATHAVLDEDHPDRSGVLLTAAPDSQDGILQLREIVPLDLDGRIVVLSSCRSASGTVLRGEGVLGLARAFFQAGAHTVVASLWPLRDDDGAALFDRFYEHLGQGESVAAALRAAQRERADEGAPAYAWAGLVVLGNGDIVPLPGGHQRSPVTAVLLFTVALGALLLGAGAVVWRRRRLPR
ncbi:MAG TPA: CHAT domain-containing protein [Thermoanaerobaculia bacterium]|nr:CHAT domain-containing protein [Thermoanaerobaculia bacterium]